MTEQIERHEHLFDRKPEEQCCRCECGEEHSLCPVEMTWWEQLRHNFKNTRFHINWKLEPRDYK